MTSPYVISIFVTSGEPDGVRVVDKSNWSGKGIVFARADLAAAVAEGMSSPGIYVLLGNDPEDTFDQQVYIGEGEDVGKRLAGHQRDDSKDFWLETVAFVSNSDALNKAHIRYIESKLIDLAHAVRRARVANSTKPMGPPMSSADRAVADGFFAEMLNIFPVLGISAFDKPEPSGTGRRHYYLKGQLTEAEGEDRSEGFYVFGGAVGRVKDTPSFSESSRALRRRLVQSGVLVEDREHYLLPEGYTFSSPSAAADALLGRSANGRDEWRDSDGISLKERQTEDAQSVEQG